jgi:endonuclease YncB( thermonuclease family)
MIEKIDFKGIGKTCLDATGARWTCGIGTPEGLAKRLGLSIASGDAHGENRYGRTLAKCVIDDDDLTAWLVNQ